MPLNVVLYFEPYGRVLFVISIDILNEFVSSLVFSPPSPPLLLSLDVQTGPL